MDFRYKPDTRFKRVDTLSKEQAAEEIRALREGINYHDYLYYVNNSPEISDAVYDKLLQRLDALEAAFPDLKTSNSPTLRVGAEPVSKLNKIEHKAPLLSLQATLEQDDIKSFLTAARKKTADQSITCMLEPKFDGLSVEVVYRHGHFEYGATRGNGEIGEDISHNLKTIRALPLSLQHIDSTPALLAVRGEVFLPKQGFTALNKKRVERGDEPFANPRNAAAGLVRQFESRQVADTPLDIFFYEILAIDGDLPSTHQGVLQRLSYWGLKNCPLNRSASTFNQIENYHRKQPGKKRSTPFHMPERCPVCDARIVREGAHYFCTAGLSCAAQLTGRIQHYAARNAMDINHLGEKSAAQLVTRGLVHDLADLYTLDVKDLEHLEGFAARSAKQLHQAIQGMKEPRLDRFLFALGIRHVGRHIARVLANEFRTLDRLADAETPEIARIPGIGEEIATSVSHFFSDNNNREVLNRLQKAGLTIQPMPKRKKHPLTGKSFVFTGSLDGFTREEAQEQVEALGARATSSVSDETDFIVVGQNPGNKLVEAEKHGVKRIDEDTFRELLDDS